MSDMDIAIGLALDVEGKRSDHPADPGGKTNLGITHKTYARAVRISLIPDVGLRNLRASHAYTIYDALYAKPIRFDALPRGLNALVFDIEVNSGRGGRTLQASLNAIERAGLRVDGAVGPRTLEAVEAACSGVNGLYGLMDEVNARRHLWWARLPIFATFGLGWLRRGSRVYSHAVRMACGDI